MLSGIYTLQIVIVVLRMAWIAITSKVELTYISLLFILFLMYIETSPLVLIASGRFLLYLVYPLMLPI